MKRNIFCLIIIAMVLWSAAPAPRSFESFFRQFNSDPSFQKEHVIFPVLYGWVEPDIGLLRTEFTNKDKWKHLSYNVDSLIFKIESSGKYVKNCIIQYPDTDTEFMLVFRNIDNDWYLSDILDYSE